MTIIGARDLYTIYQNCFANHRSLPEELVGVKKGMIQLLTADGDGEILEQIKGLRSLFERGAPDTSQKSCGSLTLRRLHIVCKSIPGAPLFWQMFSPQIPLTERVQTLFVSRIKALQSVLETHGLSNAVRLEEFLNAPSISTAQTSTSPLRPFPYPAHWNNESITSPFHSCGLRTGSLSMTGVDCAQSQSAPTRLISPFTQIRPDQLPERLSQELLAIRERFYATARAGKLIEEKFVIQEGSSPLSCTFSLKPFDAKIDDPTYPYLMYLSALIHKQIVDTTICSKAAVFDYAAEQLSNNPLFRPLLPKPAESGKLFGMIAQFYKELDELGRLAESPTTTK